MILKLKLLILKKFKVFNLKKDLFIYEKKDKLNFTSTIKVTTISFNQQIFFLMRLNFKLVLKDSKMIANSNTIFTFIRGM